MVIGGEIIGNPAGARLWVNEGMELTDTVRKLADAINATASVKNVYGEAVTVGERTVIPVARFRVGLGLGARPPRDGEAPGGRVGGGGRIVAGPSGVVEVSPAGTRFIPNREKQNLALALAAGFLAGVLATWAALRSSR